MRREEIRELLEKVKRGEIEIEKAEDILARLPYAELGFAKIDHHREIRKGFTEVVFCQGKQVEEIRAILSEMLAHGGGNLLLTRAGPEVYRAVSDICPEAEYRERARAILVWRKRPEPEGMVAILTAGTADIPVAEEACAVCEITGNAVERIYDVGVAGVHRLIAHLPVLEKANVAVVVAGMEGALASVVGGLVKCPVIAVPTSVGYGANLGGIAPLLTMLNSCAPGVAVVNIDNGFGAGYVASLINRL
ncbi:MAG: nickel pincer cofactor biosynthesis protein LarB [Candidatus Geothermincolales bacterium]